MYSQFSGLIVIYLVISARAYTIDTENDGPIVKGGTITFTAKVYDGNELADGTTFQYFWEDLAIPSHSKEEKVASAINKWTVTYNASVYPGGTYLAQVIVKRCVIAVLCYEIGSSRTSFTITETLNGDLILIQNNETRPNDYVSNKNTVVHEIILKKSDEDYIREATSVYTYWFVDCIYYGISKDLNFTFNYTDVDRRHVIESLILADFTPLPPTTTVAPTTTTIKPTASSTTTKITPTTKPTRITDKTTIKTTQALSYTTKSSASVDVKHPNKRSIEATQNNTEIKVLVNGTLVKYNGSFPMVCGGTQVSTDGNKTYGYFKKELIVKAPIEKINVTGNNWIQPGDLLSLKVSCGGSKSMQYCVEYRRGEYNITHNETCRVYYPLDDCDFTIRRYLSYPKNTILIIIKNDVSRTVTPVTVNIYKVNKQAQLSVIVVPVAFSLVAVVLIVFGIAYYFQNRSRFIVEVADFNFGQQYTDMEYKTFRERLRDSIMNAFTRGPTPSSSEVPVWPPGRKYGSMT